ncbi:MAG: 30S ribosomal protein S6 [Patescibacteria group bacterium]
MVTKTETVETVAEAPVELKTRLYLLSALAKDATGALDELADIIKGIGSKLEQSEDMGVKRLAYPIKKQSQLSLVSVFFNADPQALKDLAAELVHSEKIDRYLLTEWRAGLDEQGNKRPKRKAEEKNV